MNRLQRAYYTAQAVGWENLPRRVWQIAKGKFGMSRRSLPGGELSPEALRAHFVDDYRPDDASRFWRERSARMFIAPHPRASFTGALQTLVDEDTWRHRVSAVTAQLGAGQVPFFNHQFVDCGTPLDFNRDPIHSVTWPTGRHWSTYVQFDPVLSDIKCVWEASRFSWAYTLARDYVRDLRPEPAERFWELFELWDRQNPYGLTAQWACGQESTFRLMAWLFAATIMLDAIPSTDARLHRVSELAWYTARHIEGNINFARGQKNNHAISEAVGLWTVGLLFGELKRAAVWRDMGRRILVEELHRQIYDDGSYVQHSLNYHRVMLDDVLWAARLGELNGQPLPDAALRRVSLALDWLLEMIEPTTGRVPNYGPNDGALILPLTNCDYTDYRPVAQATNFLLRRERAFESGPWDEQMLWLFGPEALDAPVRKQQHAVTFAAEHGGYYVMRGPLSRAMIRCHSYRDRPTQADMLHLDLWHAGQNVLRDGGSYSYNCEAPWPHHFQSTAAHNTIEIDDADQMEKGARFLWLRWTRSRMHRFESDSNGRVTCFDGEHHGYTRLPGRVVHRRCVCRIDDAYVVIDDVTGEGEHAVCLRWRLCDADWLMDGDAWSAELAGAAWSLRVRASQPIEVEMLRGVEGPRPEGWESLYYNEKTPAPTIHAAARVALPLRFVTECGPRTAGALVASDAISAAPASLGVIVSRIGIEASVLEEVCARRLFSA